MFTPHIEPKHHNIIFFSFKLTVPTFKVFIKIVMFDMNLNTKDVKIKIIQKILNKKSLPKCQDKWNNVYNEEFLKCLLKL
jgi:hypothetical protein